MLKLTLAFLSSRFSTKPKKWGSNINQTLISPFQFFKSIFNYNAAPTESISPASIRLPLSEYCFINHSTKVYTEPWTIRGLTSLIFCINLWGKNNLYKHSWYKEEFRKTRTSWDFPNHPTKISRNKYLLSTNSWKSIEWYSFLLT